MERYLLLFDRGCISGFVTIPVIIMRKILTLYGRTVVLIGTGHVFTSSINEVRDTIHATQPAAVCVELDHNRYMALKSGERATFWEMVRARGAGFALFSSIMSSIQGEIGQDFGVMPGADMLAAVDSAQSVGTPVYFIDRDVSITINRLVKGMPVREKVKLFGGAFLSLLPFKRTISPSQFDERFIASLLDDFKKYSPTAYRVLIIERNIYMGRTILELIHRVGETSSVVVVVGAGHLPGMYAWLEREADDNKRKEEGIADTAGPTGAERDSGQKRVD